MSSLGGLLGRMGFGRFAQGTGVTDLETEMLE